MKIVKLTMLVATAAVATSAFIGAASASAVTSHKWIALCDSQQLLLCETTHLLKHPLLGNLRLLLGASEFNLGFVTLKCTSGEGETNAVESQQEQEPETTANVPTKAFLAKLEKLTFAGCTGCTAITVAPVELHLWMKTGLADDWRLNALNYKLTFSGCPFGTTCIYEGNLEFSVQMDAEGAFYDPEGKEFKRGAGSGALCAATGKWTSGRTRFDWKLDDIKGSVHKNVWPTLLEALTLHTGVEL
jgi:hypothetical protein